MRRGQRADIVRDWTRANRNIGIAPLSTHCETHFLNRAEDCGVETIVKKTEQIRDVATVIAAGAGHRDDAGAVKRMLPVLAVIPGEGNVRRSMDYGAGCSWR